MTGKEEEEREKKKMYGQEKKTAARMELTLNILDMKNTETTQGSVDPTSTLPGTNCIEVKEAHFNIHFSGNISMETTGMRIDEEERKALTPYRLTWKISAFYKKQKKFILEYWKSMKHQYAFR